MRKVPLLVAFLAMALIWAVPAQADPVAFDPYGTAGANSFVGTTFDWLPGNSLIIETSPFDPNTGAAGTVTVLFQANLGTIIIPGPTPDYQSGSAGSNFFTAVAGFNATFTQSGSTTTFTLDPSGTTNFFNIYANTTQADDLAGTGFTSGTLILSGSAISTDFSSNFTVSGGPDTNPAVDCTNSTLYVNCNDGITNNDLDRPLDQFDNGLGGPVDNYPGVYSILGTGSTAIKVTVNSFDSNYFLNLIAGTSLIFSNTSQIDPYNQADPSACFSLTGSGLVCEPGVSSVGLVNGSGSHIMAQADANSTFTQVLPAVPEPATLTLLGLGLTGVAGARRRQLAKKKA